MERAEKVKRKLRSLEYPSFNPKEPWTLIDRLLNDLLKASEGYQFVKMKMRDLKQELERRPPDQLDRKVGELEKDNDRLHALLIERDKEIAMLKFQRNEGFKSMDMEKGAQIFFEERDIRSEPGLDKERRLLEFDEFVKVCNAYETELFRLRNLYEKRPRARDHHQEMGQEEQRRKMLENQIEHLSARTLDLEGQLTKERERVAHLVGVETRLGEMKDQLVKQVAELRRQVGDQIEMDHREDHREVEVGRLEAEMGLMAKDIQDKERVIQGKQEEAEMMRKELDLKTGLIRTLEEKIEESKREHSRRENENEALKKRNEVSEKQIVSLKIELKEMEAKQQKNFERMLKEEEGGKKIQEMEVRIIEQEAKRGEVEEELEKEKRGRVNMEGDLRRLREELRMTKEEWERERRFQRDTDKVSRDIKVLTEEKEEREKDLLRQVGLLTENNKSKQREVEGLKNQVLMLTDEKRSLLEDIDRMSRNIEKQSRLNFEIESEKFQQRARIQELEGEKEELRKRNQELIREGRKVGDEMEREREGHLLRKELEKEKNQNDELKQIQADLRGRLVEMDLKRDRLEEDLDKKTEDLEVIRTEMKTLIEGYEERVQEVEALSSRLGQLEGELERERDANRRGVEREDGRRGELQKIKEQSEQEKSLRLEVQGDLQILNRENKQLANEVFALERKLEAGQRRRMETEEVIRELEGQVEVLRLELSQVAKTCREIFWGNQINRKASTWSRKTSLYSKTETPCSRDSRRPRHPTAKSSCTSSGSPWKCPKSRRRRTVFPESYQTLEGSTRDS